MDMAALLEGVRGRRDCPGQLEHVEVLPERPERFAQPAMPLVGAPKRLAHGRKYFALWNSTLPGSDSFARCSLNDDAVRWLELLAAAKPAPAVPTAPAL